MAFKLQFDPESISALAKAYRYGSAVERDLETKIETVISPGVRERGYFTREEFLDICRWKTARSKSRCEGNDEGFIIEATRAALSATQEELRIGILRLLGGVEWPTASVLLHFGHKDRYPILDFRALQSLGIPKPPPYDFEFWWSYVEACRRLAGNHSMREFDRALWEYSKQQSDRKTSN
jgi:hypothetical protein